MKFNVLSWAAVCFYYRSAGDRKYGKIMKDTPFISKLRESPSDISKLEFEEKVILDYIDIQHYDLLFKQDLAGKVLAKIIELEPEISSLQNNTILDCNLWDSEIEENINKIYKGLCSIQGLWVTGASKILHLINDKLFALLNSNLAEHFGIVEGKNELVRWLKLLKKEADEVTNDFREYGFSGLPETFLSDKLGYTSYGYQKSLVKFLDEYFWLRFGDNLPIPPKWVPPNIVAKVQT